MPSLRNVTTEAQEPCGSGQPIVCHNRYPTRLDPVRCPKDLCAAARGTLNDIANRIVETIGRMRQFGQLSRLLRTGSINEDHGHLISLLFTFGCESKSVKDSSEGLFSATF